MRIALIGGTGLVGGLLLRRLLKDDKGTELHALLRRPAGIVHPRLHEHVAPAGEWPGIVRTLAPEKAVSALGTTFRKAGSEAAFRKVDHDTVLQFALAAHAAGAAQMLLLSSVGADPSSRTFYLGLKGEVERALQEIGFTRFDIFRPGLLRGERSAERRLKERAAILLSPLTDLLLKGPLYRYSSIEAAAVAAAIAACIEARGSGVHIHHNREIEAIAGY